MFEDFCVCGNYVQQWLNYPKDHHPTFQNPDIQIDEDRIQLLPEDGSVHDQLLNLTTSEIDPEEDQGPLEDSDNQQTSTLMVLCLNSTIGTHEIDQLCSAACPPPPDAPVLTMPVVCGTPISEYGPNIAINAFPTLFPTGGGGFDEPREHKISEQD